MGGTEGTEEMLTDLTVEDQDGGKKKKKKKKKRGGKKAGKETEDIPQVAVEKYVHISRMQRNKRKYIAIVKGMETYGLKLKLVAKTFSKKFACTASVIKGLEPEIHIQGDVQYDLPDFIEDKWKVDRSKVFYVQKTGKRTP